MDGWDEDEIAKAIAMSLKESSAPSSLSLQRRDPAIKQEEAIELDDGDDGDLNYRRQLQQALAESQRASQATMSAQVEPAPNANNMFQAAPLGNPFLSARAALERERLERQKRTRPEFLNDNVCKEEDDNEVDLTMDDTRDTKRQRVSSASVLAHEINASSSRAQVYAPVNTFQPDRSSNSFFYDGELRQTANMRVDPQKDTRPVFRLSEILSPRLDISFVIMSAYVLNFTWMYTFLEPKTPVIAVTHDLNGEQTIKEVLPEWIKTTPFIRGGFGCMHMKFMLIFYKTGRLRVVVSTANLIEYDWRDIENSVWVQDVPARATPLPHDPKADDFAASMIKVLRAVNTAPALITLMRNGHNLPIRRLEELRANWDFSRVTVKLIPSLAGKHEGWPQVIHTGHTALMKAIRDMGARVPQGQHLMLECQGSSIGNYSTQWLNEFYCSAQGESAERWLNQSRAQRSRLPHPSIKILYPTLRTVRESELGESGGGTMFFRRNQWNSAKFPKELFHDSRSKRGRVLMHSKMIIGTFRPSSFVKDESKKTARTARDDDDIVEVIPASTQYIGWAYVGSHNFTPSAWGTLSGSDFNPSLNVTNFELGIAFPLRDEAHLSEVACWERPARKYIMGQDEPWIQSESPHFVDQAHQ